MTTAGPSRGFALQSYVHRRHHEVAIAREFWQGFRPALIDDENRPHLRLEGSRVTSARMTR